MWHLKHTFVLCFAEAACNWSFLLDIVVVWRATTLRDAGIVTRAVSDAAAAAVATWVCLRGTRLTSSYIYTRRRSYYWKIDNRNSRESGKFTGDTTRDAFFAVVVVVVELHKSSVF